MKYILVALGLALGACESPRHPDPPKAHASPESSANGLVPAAAEPQGETIRVVSYNVLFALSGCPTQTATCAADPDTLELIDRLDADVLMLQETNPAWEGVLQRRLGKKFEHSAFHDPTTSIASGLGTFSRFPIEKNELYPSPVGWFPANRLVVRTPAGPLELLNVHLRPAVSERGSWIAGFFTTGPLREKEMKAYAPRLEPDLPTIVAGDFNERDGGHALDILDSLGFGAALSEKAPDATTWRYGNALELRIDHVAYEKSAFEVVSAEVIDGGNSDHKPVRVVLKRRA